jgi:hypothetical protein
MQSQGCFETSVFLFFVFGFLRKEAIADSAGCPASKTVK